MSDGKAFNFVLFCVLCSIFSFSTYYIKLIHYKEILKESERQQKIDLDLKDAISTKISYVQEDRDKLIEV